MAYIATWNGHTFRVDPKAIYSFSDLTLKGSAETEDKDSSKQKYVQKKNSKPYEIGFTIHLDRRLGVKDVQSEAMTYCTEAHDGAEDYFYFAGKKAWKCKFMLTGADISDIEIMPDGTWLLCNVKCSWKQSTKDEEEKQSSHHSHHSSRKKSAKSSSNTMTKDDVDVVSSAAPTKNGLTNYAKNVSKSVNNAVSTKNSAKKTIRTITTSVSNKRTGFLS